MNAPDRVVSPTAHRNNVPYGLESGPQYIHAATSDNTRLAYQADIQHFLKQGGTLPTTVDGIESYLKQCAPHYNPRTLARRLTAIRQWHVLKGYPSPTQNPAIHKALRGIARLHGQPKVQTTALCLIDLDRID